MPSQPGWLCHYHYQSEFIFRTILSNESQTDRVRKERKALREHISLSTMTSPIAKHTTHKSDQINNLSQPTCFLHEFLAVLDRLIPPLLKLKHRIHSEILASSLSVGLGPPCFSGITLLFKCLVAF